MEVPHGGGRPPGWARDAIWYQVFPERFRNGAPQSNPACTDFSDKPIPGWKVSRWGMDWYGGDGWEKKLGGFNHAVYARRFGGDLVGLRRKLGYLQDLGINAIYLNPVFMAPSLHKYDAACLHHVDPTFGPDRAGDLKALAAARETEDPATWIWTAADRCLVDLVADVHRRGMRIILDGVFNHTGTRFFAFRDLRKHGRKSAYRYWYRVTRWNADGSFEYRGWFGHKGLPEFGRGRDNLAAPVRRYIAAVTRRWMDPDGDGDPGDGIDGWRLDVAFCVPHGFWKEWRGLVKSINPDAFLCGEFVGPAPDYLAGDELDSAMNYPWLFAALSFFAPSRRPIPSRELRRRLEALRRAYPHRAGYVLQNLLDSHDVGRVLTMLENPDTPKSNWDEFFDSSRVAAHREFRATRPGPRARQALRQMAIFQMTGLGAPMMYYGTEVGLWGANDPDNRQPMLWDDIPHDPETHGIGGPCPASPRRPDRALLGFFRRAIALRREHPVLRRGSLRWLETGHDRLLGFVRAGQGEEVVVLLNAGDEPLSYRLARGGADLWVRGRRIRPGLVVIEPRGWRIVGRST